MRYYSVELNLEWQYDMLLIEATLIRCLFLYDIDISTTHGAEREGYLRNTSCNKFQPQFQDANERKRERGRHRYANDVI